MWLLGRLTVATVALALLSTLGTWLALAVGAATPATELVFTGTSKQSGNELYLIDAHRLLIAQLTHSNSLKDAPVWSPDGRWLAFFERTPRNGLRMIDLNTREQQFIAGIVGGGLAWSPDGDSLAYFAARAGQFGVYHFDVTSREVTILADHYATNFVALLWSPDSRHLAYVVGSSAPGLFMIDVEGGAPIQLTPQIAQSPAWSPDSRQIVYTAGSQSDIYVLPTGCAETPSGCAEAARNLTDSPAFEGQSVWTPDGQGILLYATRACPFPTLALMSSSGGTLRPVSQGCAPLTRGPSVELAPAWSPDGHEIVITVRERRLVNIYAVVAADGQFRRLTTLPDQGMQAFFPAWRPGGEAME